MNGLTEEQERVAVNYLRERFAAYAVILFGSAAKGQLRQDSDIDLAILSDQKPEPYDLFMAAQHLADKLGREVDLVSFAQASSVFKAQIVGAARVLYDGNPYERQQAFIQGLKEYAMLNEERACILEQYGWKKGEDGFFGYTGEQNTNHSSLPHTNS